MMRAIFVVLMIAGIGLGFVYPWYLEKFSESEVTRISLLDAQTGTLQTPEINLAAGDGPVRVMVDLVPQTGFVPSDNGSSLTLAVSRDGHPVLSQALTFTLNSSVDGGGLQQSAGDIDPVISGNYAFNIVWGNIDEKQITKVDLELRRVTPPLDEKYISAGLMMAVLGFYGLMRTRLRRPRK